mgnify:CR=1 FL=1
MIFGDIGMNIIEVLTDMVVSFGYIGIFVATSLEYGCFPVSSEVLLPFIGYFAFKGNMSILGAISISTLGGIIGSLFCYGLGRFGKNFIENTLCCRFKTVGIGLDNADRVFRKYGKQSVLVARVFPIARTYISIPAGLAAMDIRIFVLYTALGAFMWNTALISAGYFLGSYWGSAGEILKDRHIIFCMVTAVLSIILLKLSIKK